jgi:MinD superfamily P-loop ATPase
VRRAQAAVLVSEPTPFGEHDLLLATAMCKELGIPGVVVVNRCDIAPQAVLDRMQDRLGVEVIQMPFDVAVARAYGKSERLLDASPRLRVAVARVAAALQRLSSVAEGLPPPAMATSGSAE